jgi:hypothetical protein
VNGIVVVVDGPALVVVAGRAVVDVAPAVVVEAPAPDAVWFVPPPSSLHPTTSMNAASATAVARAGEDDLRRDMASHASRAVEGATQAARRNR